MRRDRLSASGVNETRLALSPAKNQSEAIGSDGSRLSSSWGRALIWEDKAEFMADLLTLYLNARDKKNPSPPHYSIYICQ